MQEKGKDQMKEIYLLALVACLLALVTYLLALVSYLLASVRLVFCSVEAQTGHALKLAKFQGLPIYSSVLL